MAYAIPLEFDIVDKRLMRREKCLLSHAMLLIDFTHWKWVTTARFM
jgi:hypothetical protein